MARTALAQLHEATGHSSGHPGKLSGPAPSDTGAGGASYRDTGKPGTLMGSRQRFGPPSYWHGFSSLGEAT